MGPDDRFDLLHPLLLPIVGFLDLYPYELRNQDVIPKEYKVNTGKCNRKSRKERDNTGLASPEVDFPQGTAVGEGLSDQRREGGSLVRRRSSATT
jgi:hypothetical protein